MKTKFEVEVCVDSIESAIVAENAGANRIELCSSLAEGGLTPSFALIALSKKILKIPIMVMIRPRAGDFYYSELEFEVMKKDILCCKELQELFWVGLLRQFSQVWPAGQHLSHRLQSFFRFYFHHLSVWFLVFTRPQEPLSFIRLMLLGTSDKKHSISNWEQCLGITLKTCCQIIMSANRISLLIKASLKNFSGPKCIIYNNHSMI
jgi:copper homeostasis protein